MIRNFHRTRRAAVRGDARQPDAGFSLIELLVVIVVLGVLATIAVLNLTGVSGKANRAACQSDVATINNAANLYFAEKGQGAATLNDLVTNSYLKPSTAIQGNTWVQSSYRVQFVPATPASSGPGNGVGVGSTGCTSSAPSADLTGPLTIGAATSLTTAFNTGKALLQSANPSLAITYTFGASGTVLTTISNAPAGTYDVFASADIFTMNQAVAAGRVTGPVTFVKNKLIIAVAAGNPLNIKTINDLYRPGVRVAFGGCGVPAGRYARQMLLNNGITASQPCGAPVPADDTPIAPVPAVPTVGNVTAVGYGSNVANTLALVTGGSADAALVYVTDIGTSSAVVGVQIPDAQNVTPVYPIAIVTGSTHQAAAQAFIDQAVSGDLQTTLRAYGFLPPT